MEEQITDGQQSIREKRIANLAPYQYKKGQSGNSLGRYLGGISGKERLKRKIAGMSDEEFEEWCEGINKLDLFKMAEGNPEQKGELVAQVNINQVLNELIDPASKETFE